MKYADKNGKAVYLNIVNKGHGDRWVVTAISGQTLKGRDGEKRKSRTFKTEHTAWRFLANNGYEEVSYE